ncbi:LysR family transcriptional regulator [Burkholderia gladioli]|uniref:LysR family transcriptional regulator n=1 Tax=Burkholderia gladioli TaxID=28095 RepID=UPI0016415D93|nr:LysR family transcriptional regulator [Burkholderia gladioli]
MRIVNDRVEEMRIFVKIVELLSFTRAAEAMQLTTPTVSRVMRRLEERTRLRLLSRSTRSVGPTPEGYAYYEGCVALLDQLDRLDRSTELAAGVPEGRVRVALPAPFAQHLLIPALPLLFEAYPALDVEIVAADGELNLVEAGVDCALRVGAIRETSLVARPVGHAAEIFCAAPAYLRRHAEPRELTQLRAHPIVGNGVHAPGEWDEGEKIVVRGALRQRASTADANAYLACAVAGLGIAFGYRLAFQPCLDAGTLREILPAHRPPPKPVHIVYYPSQRMPNRVRVFVDWFREVLIEALDEAARDAAAPHVDPHADLSEAAS